MKNWKFIPKLAAAALLLCAVASLSAQDSRFSHIPDAAALVVKLDLEKLNSSPAFRLVADSGELAAIRDDLKQIPWTGNAALPDPVIVFAPEMGRGFVMLVETDKSPDELAEQMAARYGDGMSVESRQYAIGDTITVRQTVKDRKGRPRPETRARLVYLSLRTVAFGREDSPLSYRFFADDMLPSSDFAKLEDASEDIAAAGIMRSFPVPASDDPTGLSALVETGEFTLSERKSGEVALSLRFECKGEKEARLAARRLKSFARIALVSLFAADQGLFKELNDSCTTSCDGNRASLELKLPKAAVEGILAFYRQTPKKSSPVAAPAAEQEVGRK